MVLSYATQLGHITTELYCQLAFSAEQLTLTWFFCSRAKLKLQLSPHQPTSALESVRRLVFAAFVEPAVAQWWQYLGSGEMQPARHERKSTYIEWADFTELDSGAGWMQFEVQYVMPHSSRNAALRVHSEAMLACLRSFERTGVVLAGPYTHSAYPDGPRRHPNQIISENEDTSK